ncbi:MAG: chemotaxis protein CheW [Oscillospiraceae bacterium]|nr:chemotaxis protein CheW [Oscillospiraceae bacterium]
MSTEDNKYLIFNLGKEVYGIPILKVKNIERMMDITPVPRTPGFVKGITNLRGKIIPVMDLKEKFGIGSAQVTERTCTIIVDVQTDTGMHTNGLMVDEVSEVLDISDGYIEPVPKYGDMSIDQEFMSGIGKIKDSVIILLDIQKILDFSEYGVMASVEI